MLKKILIVACSLAISNAYCENIPLASAKDYRIKFVEYDPYDVVKINVTQGYASQITLSEDEIIQGVNFGVKKNWEYNIYKNILYIKPKLKTVTNSNVLLTTTKRNYNLEINVCPDDCGKKLTYNLIYTYGNNKSKENQQKKEQETAKQIIKNYKIDYKNYQYTAQGNQELRPIDTWDNGQFTYLKFANNKNMPAVYLIQDDKTESLTNNHIENKNTIVIHQLAKTFILRSGRQVLAIHNENYGKNIINTTNTASPYIERVNNDK